jgi:type II secretory pathway component PulF
MATKNSKVIRTNRELMEVSFIFRNLYKAGNLSAAEVMVEAGNMLPRFKGILNAGAKRINTSGSSLSLVLESVFPQTVMPAIVAGEEAGSLDNVFDQIWQTSKTQESINKVLRGLRTPFGLMVTAIAIGLSFYLFLVPQLYEAIRHGLPNRYSPPAVVSMALHTNAFILDWWLAILAVFAASMLGISAYLSKEENRRKSSNFLISQLLKVKGIGFAYSLLKFGITARYFEIVSSAGLPMDEQIKYVVKTLPEPLQPGLKAFGRDMGQQGLLRASDNQRRDVSDPRSSLILWPPYIRLAFRQAHQTGSVTEPMREYGVVMIEDGREKIQKTIETLNTIGLILTGVAVAAPLSMVYTVLGSVLTAHLQNS